ncbi:hypothetical protein J5N97_022719 [Dioscorea zingiberensis]|uniref:Uncharacterized protein n=1 Tax=Dioscorea zingiberensis TaxID=325984 RepID=A0A9D5HB33_9LILI|nr:hypothetical protein J5N97_022719 [Dioscorea zingiberensis]
MAKPKVVSDYKMIKKKPWSTPSPTLMKSVTLYEIEEFWRRKRMEEEEHLLAAEKAAARIKARSLLERDYKLFEEGMLRIMEEHEGGYAADGDDSKDLPVGIKDWWTKSKYAYLNQPAIKFMEKNAMPRGGTSTYTPQKVYCVYTCAEHQQFTISSLGVH